MSHAKTDAAAATAPEAQSVLSEWLRDGHPLEVPVQGFSMSPFLRPGDRLVIETLAGAGPRCGDIVIVSLGGTRWMAHRVVSRTSEAWLTRGDAALQADRPVATQEIYGVVRHIRRADRRRRFGLGPERIVIAWLSRRGILSRLLSVGRKLLLR